jgi:hypothetical protein
MKSILDSLEKQSDYNKCFFPVSDNCYILNPALSSFSIFFSVLLLFFQTNNLNYLLDTNLFGFIYSQILMKPWNIQPPQATNHYEFYFLI